MTPLYCQIRKELVAALPEELVRQKLVDYMIRDLAYPEGLIAVEKGLSQMPHLILKGQKIPKRRADIICYGKGIHPQHNLYPLLLVECKAIKLTPKVINQVSGYNHYLQAYFICIANKAEIRTGWYDRNKKEYAFIDYLPRYEQLLRSLTSMR
jgi:Type I restriction enzyme R protein N terminus (HSDR_N)